jgi:hypothetical protein
MPPAIDPSHEKVQLTAKIETRHRQPDLCTIYEPDAQGRSKMSRWITAKGEAFVDVETTR